MVEKLMTYDIEVLKHLQKKILLAYLPFISNLSVDAQFIEGGQPEGFFFDVIPITHEMIDIIVGYVEGPEVSSIIMATAIKLTLQRFNKPLYQGYYFDKIRLWDKNILTINETIQKIYTEYQALLHEFHFSLRLFYGRLNLNYSHLEYVNCGGLRILHCNSMQQRCGLLKSTLPSVEKIVPDQLQTFQVLIEPNDLIIFHVKKIIEEEELQPLITFLQSHVSTPIYQLRKQIQDITQPSTHDANSLIVILRMDDNRIDSSRNHLCARFASDVSQLQVIRNFVQKVCQQLPGDADKLSLQLQLVLDEIFCNIVKHSYHDNVKGEILIETDTNTEGIYFTISDKGDSFNPLEVKYPNFTGEQEDGFGFFIIQQIADHLAYTPKTSENDWNHLRIFKRYFSQEDHMDFSHHIQDNVLIITPQGESLDAKNAAYFKENVLNLIKTSKIQQLVFDLRQLQFIDSSGLGSFLAIQRSLNAQGGVLKLANLNKPIRTMFEIVSMHRIFEIFDATEKAISSF